MNLLSRRSLLAIAAVVDIALHSRASPVAAKALAESLGGVESLVEHRASIEGEGTPCPADLLRLSTGLEDPDDLFFDLLRALDSAA